MDMRKINKIIIHHTYSDSAAKVESIVRYWKTANPETKKKGWKYPGYHFIIEPSGQIHQLLPIEKVSNGVKGHNQDSINIGYIGGKDEYGKAYDGRTLPQKLAILYLVQMLKFHLKEAYNWNVAVKGHNDFTDIKECPGFKVSPETLHEGVIYERTDLYDWSL